MGLGHGRQSFEGWWGGASGDASRAEWQENAAARRSVPPAYPLGACRRTAHIPNSGQGISRYSEL